MQTTRRQDYRYQVKTVSMKDGEFNWSGVGEAAQASDTVHLQVAVPEDIVELIGLSTMVVLSPEVSGTNAKLVSIGTGSNVVAVNKSFANGQISVNLDLSFMVDKFDIHNDDQLFPQPYIQLDMKLSGNSTDLSANGKVKLWKVDMIYTTLGTR